MIAKPNMGHGIIHDQSARRRETVSLRLRFLHDYVVFDFYVDMAKVQSLPRENLKICAI